jgi:AraC family transcriptional regulator
MEPRIGSLTEKKIIGKRKRMSLADNRTGELWRSFMNFNPATEFEKFAGIEVANSDNVPEEMETFILSEGLMLFFYIREAPVRDSGLQTFQYIFGT